MQDGKESPEISTSTADPQSLLTSLLSDPNLLERMKDVFKSSVQTASNGSAQGTAEPEDANGVKTASNSESPVNDRVDPNRSQHAPDGLASILSDPAVLEKIPQVMAMLQPMTDRLSASSPADGGSRSDMVGGSAERDRLLLALKPFLSRERQEAVDALLRIAKLGILLKQLT